MILWFYKFLILKLQILRRTHVNEGSFRGGHTHKRIIGRMVRFSPVPYVTN